MKRLISITLVLLMCIPILIACQDDNLPNSGSPDDSSETPKGLVPHLGERDLDNFTLTFFTFGVDEDLTPYEKEQFNIDEIDSEPVNEAFYERNRKIEDKYNCKIELLHGERWLDFPNVVRQRINTGDDSFNVLAETLINIAIYSQEDLLTELTDLSDSNLHLSDEWWDQSLISQCSINNRLDFITGDITVTDNEATYAILFNKEIIKQNGIEDPYELVKSKEWTFDKMFELARAVVKDDGDSVMTVTGNDIWGVVAPPQSPMNFLAGFGITGVTKDRNDLPVIAFNDQNFISAYQKAYTNLCDLAVTAMDRYFYDWDDEDLKIVKNNFPNGKVLFNAIATIGEINSPELRDSDVDFGVLPYPLLNETQEEYCSPIHLYKNGFISIPRTVSPEDYDKITFILEAMSYLGREMVLDEYYTRTLKRKRTTDEESREMLDIIFGNRVYDLSIIFGWGDILYENTYNVLAKTDTIVSRLDKISSKIQIDMERTIDKFLE